MKNLVYYLSFTLCLLHGQFSFSQNWSEERTVRATASINGSKNAIKVEWLSAANTAGYAVYRRSPGAISWGTAVASLPPTDTSYTDNSVSGNTLYEYRVVRTSTYTEPFATGGVKAEGYAFLMSGIEMEPVHHRGQILLISTKLIADSLSAELNQLKMDLIGDGWIVEIVSLNANDSVSAVKALIDSRPEVNTVYLLGNVPYPYSGLYCSPNNYVYPPDGHNEKAGGHCGAWPADVYYGVKAGSWTDMDSTTLASRTENDNLIGDGKFDNNSIPGIVEIEVGRVDLSRLPTLPENELQLMRRYLMKVHEFRHATTNYLHEAIIENNFAAYEEGFSSAAIADFNAYLGYNKTINADLFTTTAGNNYLFSYTCGAGSYTSCSGVGNTASFLTKNPAMFNHMFGSYFGDMDIANNIARASLASQQGGLTTIWSGRPKWATHGLAMGDHFGKLTVKSQNNSNQYALSGYQNFAHIMFIGDPSLRTAMFEPASNVVVTMDNDSSVVSLDWTASNASGVIGYYVYWSANRESGYTLLTQVPVTGNSFTHYTPTFGDNYYMVRAERLETTASGSYYNLSQAAFATASGVKRTATVPELKAVTISLYPIPAGNHIGVRMAGNEFHAAEIVNQLGQTVKTNLSINDGSRIELSELTPGIYFLRGKGFSRRFVKI